ncbi:MAG: peroxiredoxin family protein [Thermoproteota archaeon]
MNLHRTSNKVLLILIFIEIEILSGSMGKPIALVDRGEEAPDFTLMSIYNETITLSKYRERIVLLDFWTTWCGPCQEEVKELSQLYSKYRDDGLIIISINILEDIQSVRTFAESNGMDWIVVLDKDGNVAMRYGVVLIPSLVLVHKNGTIAYVDVGFVDSDKLSLEVDKALGNPYTESKGSILLAGLATSFCIIPILLIIKKRAKIRSFLEKL